MGRKCFIPGAGLVSACLWGMAIAGTCQGKAAVSPTLGLSVPRTRPRLVWMASRWVLVPGSRGPGFHSRVGAVCRAPAPALVTFTKISCEKCFMASRDETASVYPGAELAGLDAHGGRNRVGGRGAGGGVVARQPWFECHLDLPMTSAAGGIELHTPGVQRGRCRPFPLSSVLSVQRGDSGQR